MAEISDIARCKLCGEPMPDGEQMFKYHGYSGPCPRPPIDKTIARPKGSSADEWNVFLSEHGQEFSAVKIAEAIDDAHKAGAEEMREAAAKLCDDLEQKSGGHVNRAALWIAQAIRSLPIPGRG